MRLTRGVNVVLLFMLFAVVPVLPEEADCLVAIQAAIETAGSVMR